MSKPDIPFDVSYSMPDGGRAVATAPDEMRRAVAWLEDQAEITEDQHTRARLLALAGGYAGMVGELPRAHDLLQRAIELADSIGATRQALVARIRLADVTASRGQPLDAASRLSDLLDHHRLDCQQHGVDDAVHQHLGKALLEAGEPARAVTHLQQALELRRARGDEELLASTLAALEAARRQL